MFKNYDVVDDLTFSSVIELDLSTVQPSIAGPKRPHDYCELRNHKTDWVKSLTNQVGFKGFGLKAEDVEVKSKFECNGK